MTLETWQYMDPCEVLQRKQEAAAHQAAQRKAKCGACKHDQTLVINFEVQHACALQRYDWRRCTYFEAKKGTT